MHAQLGLPFGVVAAVSFTRSGSALAHEAKGATGGGLGSKACASFSSSASDSASCASTSASCSGAAAARDKRGRGVSHSEAPTAVQGSAGISRRDRDKGKFERTYMQRLLSHGGLGA